VSLEVEAVFGRAGGTVEGVVEIALRQSGSGTRVVVGGQLDIAPGAAPLSAEALDSAFQRVVQRWFAALAETSPAAKPSAEDRAEQHEQRGQTESAADSQAPEPEPPNQGRPRKRTAERAPLAVVRDLSAGQEKRGAVSAAPVQLPQPAEPEPQGSSPSNGWPKTAKPAADEDAAAEAQTPATRGAEPHSHVPLRLVTPAPEPAQDIDEPSEPEATEAESNQTAAVTEHPAEAVELSEAAESAEATAEAAEPEPDDIWSRLRDRSVPPWIPFLIGAATATLAAVGFVFAALRRRYRR
jgi:hypothetical protein